MNSAPRRNLLLTSTLRDWKGGGGGGGGGTREHKSGASSTTSFFQHLRGGVLFFMCCGCDTRKKTPAPPLLATSWMRLQWALTGRKEAGEKLWRFPPPPPSPSSLPPPLWRGSVRIMPLYTTLPLLFISLSLFLQTKDASLCAWKEGVTLSLLSLSSLSLSLSVDICMGLGLNSFSLQKKGKSALEAFSYLSQLVP